MFSTIASTTVAYLLFAATTIRSFAFRKKYKRNGPRHLILIAWSFPPAVTGGVYRPLSFVRKAVERGWQVTVICGPSASPPDDAGLYLEKRIPKEVEIIRTLPSRLQPSHNWFPRIDGGFLNSLNIARTSIVTKGPCLVLASGPPFSSFVGGRLLARRLRAPLVLDYRDEWTLCPFDFINLGNSDKFWEKSCLAFATAILVTTKSFADELLENFSLISKEKLLLVKNGYEPEYFGGQKTVSPRSSGNPFTICYFGYLAEHINPAGFVANLENTLSEHPELRGTFRLRFVGKRSKEAEDFFMSCTFFESVELVDQVGKDEAGKLMLESDALILFNPPNLARYLPGKLFDYIASGSKLFVYGAGGEVGRAIAESETGEVIPENNPAEMAKCIQKLQKMSNTTSEDARKSWLTLHERDRIAANLFDELDLIVNKHLATRDK